ncbi:MAG: hypothetical protein AAB403_11265, partial [Planctomycetota bacterium]
GPAEAVDRRRLAGPERGPERTVLIVKGHPFLLSTGLLRPEILVRGYIGEDRISVNRDESGLGP